MSRRLINNFSSKANVGVTFRDIGDYPQFAHTRPQVSERSDGSYLLVYEEKLRTGDGLSIMSRLRVVADANGEILKISVSR